MVFKIFDFKKTTTFFFIAFQVRKAKRLILQMIISLPNCRNNTG